jgi:hypothetical protein
LNTNKNSTQDQKDTAPRSSEIDKAYQELAKLEAMKPSNRTEELSVRMKVTELKNFLSGKVAAGQAEASDQFSTNDGEPPKMKPRPTKTTGLVASSSNEGRDS